MKSIVILSGKGGVGKSSIAASLTVCMSKDHEVLCADCDVDASNLSLIFGMNEEDYEEWTPLTTNQVATIDLERCIRCGTCADTCFFNAIDMRKGIPKTDRFGCEGCGACKIICPTKAITLKDVENADIGYCTTKNCLTIVSAQLRPGSAGSGKVVSKVRERARELGADMDLLIIDAAAGIGCPVIASVNGNDYALIVTEPTPSGFSDMKKALALVEHFRITCGILINKFDINEEYTKIIEKFCKDKSLSILAKIPFDKTFPKAMVSMIPLIEFDERYVPVFQKVSKRLLEEVNQ